MRHEFQYKGKQLVMAEGGGTAAGNIAMALGAWYLEVVGQDGRYQCGAILPHESVASIEHRGRELFDLLFEYPRVKAGINIAWNATDAEAR